MDAPLHSLYVLKDRCYSLFEDRDNRVHYGIVECIHSYQSLRLILNRFTPEERLYYAELDALLPKTAPLEAGPRAVSAEEQIRHARLSAVSSLIRLDIESFYTVSKQLLDRSADLFKFIFNIVVFDQTSKRHRELGSTFVQFEKHFDFAIQERNLTAECRFKPQLLQLRKSIVEYRNNWLEHLDDFGRGRGMKGTKISWHRKSTDARDVEIEPLARLHERIQEYLFDFVHFLDTNLERSSLPRKSI